MSTAIFCPPLNQIAFSVIDLRRTEAWFVEGLGFLPSGGSILLMSSPIAGRVMGIPGAASCAWWLVGRNAWFQLELFQFRQPVANLMPADFRPCDIGYTRMGVHVHDFDVTLANLQQLGTVPLAPAVGAPGQRRVCVRSPDGVFIEIMEDDPLPQAPGSERDDCAVAVRSVTMSTPDFDASVAYLTAVNGKGPQQIFLHDETHEALWGLSGARCKRAVFHSGDILVEVVEYSDPVAKPWLENYRICDQGILNICYGQRSRAEHTLVYERTLAFGARPNCKPIHIDKSGVVYMNDSLGFSVEITWIPEGPRDLKYGFEPLPRTKRPQHDKLQVAGSVRITAPAELVWQILNHQNSMAHWCGFDSVQRTRDGEADVNGRGSQRLMRGSLGTVLEQITSIDPGHCIRYRVIDGGPIQYHNGEIVLRPLGDGCEVEWVIRCRSKYPLLGGLLRSIMQGMLSKMLKQGLKPFAERAASTRQ